MTTVYLSASGKPFKDPDAAARKARTLTQELGEPYVVRAGPVGDYIVVPSSEKDAMPEPVRVREHVSPASREEGTAEGEQKIWTKHPAWRSFYLEFVLLGVGAYYLVQKEALLTWLYYSYLRDVPGVVSLLNYHSGTAVAVAMAVVAIRVIWIRQSHRYWLYADRVQTRIGFIFEDEDVVPISRIYSAQIRRPFWERILVIGNLELSTPATSGSEIRMPRLSNPRRVKEQIMASQARVGVAR